MSLCACANNSLATYANAHARTAQRKHGGTILALKDGSSLIDHALRRRLRRVCMHANYIMHTSCASRMLSIMGGAQIIISNHYLQCYIFGDGY